MLENYEHNFLIVYSYKDDTKLTIFYYDEKIDIFDIFNMISGLLIRNMPFVENVIKGLITRLNSATTPELGLNPNKVLKHLKMCCDDNRIYIDENEKNIRVSFRDFTISYELDGYHKND